MDVQVRHNPSFAVARVNLTPSEAVKVEFDRFIAAGDLENVLRDLEAKSKKALIMDLRFNTGGLLDSAPFESFLQELCTRHQPYPFVDK